jgi:hypothetical protein
MKTRYAHCVRADHTQLDRAPHSAYEWRDVDVQAFHYPDDGDGFESYIVEFDGRPIGQGDSMADAISAAQYWLMARSRDQARTRSYWRSVSPRNCDAVA